MSRDEPLDLVIPGGIAVRRRADGLIHWRSGERSPQPRESCRKQVGEHWFSECVGYGYTPDGRYAGDVDRVTCLACLVLMMGDR